MYYYRIILFILVYLLVFKPEFIFIPRSVNSFLGILGIIVYIYNYINNKLFYDGRFFSVLDFAKNYYYVLIVSVFCFMINDPFDLYYVYYLFSIIFAYYANYLIANVSCKIYGRFGFDIYMKYLIIAEIVYLIFSIVRFLNPAFNDLVLMVTRMTDEAAAAYERTEGLRLQGIGASYFSAGIVNGYFLIVLSIYMVLYNIRGRIKMLYFGLYLFVSLVGMMMARTTIVGVFLSVILTIKYYSFDSKFFIKSILFILFLVFIAEIFMIYETKIFDEELGVLFNFAFEMFINQYNNGNISTASTDVLFSMWEIFPTTIKTWMIGDGLRVGRDGVYYMHTDVGYLRDVFYFGLIGTIFLFIYYCQSIKKCIIKSGFLGNKSRFVYSLFMVYLLLINAKGNFDLIWYIIPFYFFNDTNHINNSVILYKK